MSDIKGLIPLLKGKMVEINVGENFEEIQLSDHNQNVNGSIFGILEDIIGDFVVLNCFYFEKDKKMNSGNIVFINAWHIKAMTELNNKGSLSDVFLSVSHARKMKKLLKISG